MQTYLLFRPHLAPYLPPPTPTHPPIVICIPYVLPKSATPPICAAGQPSRIPQEPHTPRAPRTAEPNLPSPTPQKPHVPPTPPKAQDLQTYHTHHPKHRTTTHTAGIPVWHNRYDTSGTSAAVQVQQLQHPLYSKIAERRTTTTHTAGILPVAVQLTDTGGGRGAWVAP